MSEELKSTLKYLKNKNNTRRIKAITITEAQKVVEEIERLHIIIEESIKLTNKVNEMESARDLYDLVVDIKNKLKDSDKE